MIGAERIAARLADRPRELLEQIGRFARQRGEPAWLVGGKVRDLILERNNEDIDVVVEGDGMALAQDLARARGGRLMRHHRFGTARVDLPDGGHVDFATARAESYARSGDLPRVRAGNLEEDLARRDFTINAIALSLPPGESPRLADPFDGLGDLDAGRIRILHEGSFVDDPTRALRAIRFALRFGYEIEERTASALEDAGRGGYLERISGDRLRRELGKLLDESPVTGPERLARYGLLAGIHTGLRYEREPLERLREAGVTGDPPGWPFVLATLAAELSTQARWELVRRLRLSRAQRAPLIDAGSAWDGFRRMVTDDTTEAVERVEALEALDPGAVRVGLAVTGDAELSARVRDLSQLVGPSRPELDGDALIALGCPPGPRVGELLRRLRAARISGEVESARQERELARRWIQERTAD